MTTALTKKMELAYNADGDPITVEDNLAYWLIRRRTLGRPSGVSYEGSPAIVGRCAEVRDVRTMTGDRPGWYLLYQLDKDGEEIEDAEFAEVFIEEPYNHGRYGAAINPDRVFDMYDRLMSNLESKDMMMTEITKALIHSQRELQAGAVELMQTANATVNVASGIDRPELDMDTMCQRFADTLDERNKKEADMPWFAHVLNGPIGTVFAQFLMGVTQSVTVNRGKK